MATLREIKVAIQRLPDGDLRQLAVWFQEYVDEIWDREIEANLISGKLDNLIARVEEDITANRVIDLDEVLRILY